MEVDVNQRERPQIDRGLDSVLATDRKLLSFRINPTEFRVLLGTIDGLSGAFNRYSRVLNAFERFRRKRPRTKRGSLLINVSVIRNLAPKFLSR